MWGCVVECDGECGAVWWSVMESVGLCEGECGAVWWSVMESVGLCGGV